LVVVKCSGVLSLSGDGSMARYGKVDEGVIAVGEQRKINVGFLVATLKGAREKKEVTSLSGLAIQWKQM
jgi:hypothetical protein